MNFKETLAQMTLFMSFVIGAALLMSLGACSMTPTYYKVEVEHVSHPFAGWPFGPADEEDALTQANILTVIERGNVTVEQGLGYKINEFGLGGGFYGPKLTYTGRISYKFGQRKGPH